MPHRVYTGRLGKCPCCGETTFVRLAYLLGSIRVKQQIDWEVPEDFLEVAIDYLWKWGELKGHVARNKVQKREPLRKPAVRCESCGKHETVMFWAVIEDHTYAGAWCKGCLMYRVSGLAHQNAAATDFPIYMVRITKDLILEVARFVKWKAKELNLPVPIQGVDVPQARAKQLEVELEDAQLF